TIVRGISDLLFLLSILILFFFFFSSRRRHTRWPRDWSSDVCSSDLLRERSGRQNLSAFHIEMILGAGQRIILAGFLDRAAGGGGHPKRAGSSHGISVEALVRPRVPSLLAAISQREDYDAIGLARQAPRGCGDFTVRKRNVDDVRINFAVLPAAPCDVVRQFQFFRGLGADQCGVVPRELGD